MINVAQTFSGKVNDIYFYSFTLAEVFSFKAFLTDYNDQYTANWSPQEIYGRMDPVFTYKNTVRKISLAFDVPSYDVPEALQNSIKADKLIKALYPTYQTKDGSKGTALLSSPPLFKIKFANLIMNATKDAKSNDPKDSGLLGWIDGFSFKPELDSGFFVEPNIIKNSNNKVYPKLYKVSFGFNVIHEHDLGSEINKEGVRVIRMRVNSKRSQAFSHKFQDDGESLEDTPPPPDPIPETPKTPTNAAEEARSAGTTLQLINPGGETQDPNSSIKIVQADFSSGVAPNFDGVGKRNATLTVLTSRPRPRR